MLNYFDLYDLHEIFTNVRNDPYCTLNEKIMSKTLQVLKDRNYNFEVNQFRSALCTLDLSSHPEYSFVFTQNIYPHIPYLIKEYKIYRLLEEACEELLNVVKSGNHDQIRDLSEALHNLPLILAENGLSIPKTFWDYDIQRYRKKWDKMFLKKNETT